MKFENLSSRDLQALHRKDDRVVVVKIILLISIWAGLGTLVLRSDSYYVKILLWVAIGFFLNGLVSLWHDSWHYTLFRRRSWNVVSGHLLGALWGITFGPSRHAHLNHHKFNRTLQDPDAYNAGKKSRFLVFSYYTIIHFGFIMSITHFNVFYPLKYFDRRRQVRHYLGYLVLLTAYAVLFFALWKTNQLLNALEVWIIPLFFLNLWAGYKSVADHYLNKWRGTELETATTVTSSALWTYFWNGLNYHLEHHLWPQIPGYNLSKVHQVIAPELRERKALIFDSYFKVFWGCLRAGPTFIDEENNFFRLKRNEEK